ncbi:type II toxin-antitoxin system VapB family antitoxin [Geodermatophilus sp. DSM 44513]|uniref:type II toxin-antitoxin system VapB family antitoxin n=1 Tax=Geodermatophilus sp. DSM 44513 TaxID=1528104 RepID=UPI001AA18185|nr:type II toxin-antitoxin system VapB family antitoxin [Geodermatophilus sp. DSM 44513]WNV76500.1 type II toxin-antitoxin system VapB family antitoxin [Geodermatophilus sp. DSM 44513]
MTGVRTTLALDDDLLAEAQRLTGTTDTSALVRGAAGADRTGERPSTGPTGRHRTELTAAPRRR